MSRTLLDTGPLVAFFNRNDQWHQWAKAQMGALAPPRRRNYTLVARFAVDIDGEGLAGILLA